MCDTIVALRNSTRDGAVLFGKNSDRQRNEAQAVEFVPRADYRAPAGLACTYITIPQVARTHAALICRPCWIWGAEMGANEHGVTIGNEGLYARAASPQERALIGMDLVRLGLERAATAAEAVAVITTLLRRHGQGGNCGHVIPSHYHNGFIIADPSEAFVLETVGREWLLERVEGARSISNRYTIERDVCATSPGLAALVHGSGWNTEGRSGYAEAIADPSRDHVGNANARYACSSSLLRRLGRSIAVEDIMAILRDHGSGDEPHPQWNSECLTRRTLCMHAGADDRPGQTVGSLVSELRGSEAIHWVTATAAPCISIFKPVLMGVPLQEHGLSPHDRFDSGTLWWQHECLHRTAIRGDFAAFSESVRAERDAIEAQFRAQVQTAIDEGSPAARVQVVKECWREAIQVEARWLQRLGGARGTQGAAHIIAWERMNRLAGAEI